MKGGKSDPITYTPSFSNSTKYTKNIIFAISYCTNIRFISQEQVETIFKIAFVRNEFLQSLLRQDCFWEIISLCNKSSPAHPQRSPGTQCSGKSTKNTLHSQGPPKAHFLKPRELQWQSGTVAGRNSNYGFTVNGCSPEWSQESLRPKSETCQNESLVKTLQITCQTKRVLPKDAYTMHAINGMLLDVTGREQRWRKGWI